MATVLRALTGSLAQRYAGLLARVPRWNTDDGL